MNEIVLMSMRSCLLTFSLLFLSAINAIADGVGGKKNGVENGLKTPSVSMADLSDAEFVFQSHLWVYCGTLTQIDTIKEFKNKILNPMAQESPGGDFSRFFLTPGCEPRYIGRTMAPIIHVAAENSTDRLIYIVYLQKMYAEKQDLATFKKIVNAKNTQGQTVLDYVQYMVENRRLVKEEEAGLNKFVKFVCDNGGESAHNKKACPASYITL